MNDVIEMEIVKVEASPVDKQLVAYAEKTGLEKQSTETLVEAFRPIFVKSRAAMDAAKGVAESVKDATCVTEIRKSRACRLAIRAVRLESEATRKKHKEHALLYGRAVDGFHNILMADLAPVETALQEAEDTAERAEAARKAALRATREAELAPLLEIPWMGDLSMVSEVQYGKMLADAKLLRQVKLDAAAKIEAERIAKEKAEREERERIAAEVARLKQEAIASEAAARAEREAAEQKIAFERAKALEAAKAAEAKAAKMRAENQAAAEAAEKVFQEKQAIAAANARAEREAVEAKARAEAEKAAKEAARLNAELAAKAKAWRETIEAEARSEREGAAKQMAKLNAELAAKARAEHEANMKAGSAMAAAELAAKKAAAAPDKAKLKAFAQTVRELSRPVLRDAVLQSNLSRQQTQFADWIEEQAEKL